MNLLSKLSELLDETIALVKAKRIVAERAANRWDLGMQQQQLQGIQGQLQGNQNIYGNQQQQSGSQLAGGVGLQGIKGGK